MRRIKKRILVVDDERAIAQLVKAVLEKTGAYEVCAETEAKQALKTAKEFKPDLIFMDVNMPNLQGGELVARFKEDSDLKEVPVIFLTGSVTQTEVSKGGGIIGGHPFLAKPVKPADLIAAAKRHLGPPPK